MSSGAHMQLKKHKGKLTWFLEIGWYEAEVVKVVEPFCLTKPWYWGGLTSGGKNGWTVFNLKTKNEIAQFTKKEDAIKYFDYLIKTRQ